MSKVITDIEIIFENMDSIVIPARYFLDFEFDSIHNKIRRVAINAILNYSVADTIMFVLDGSANNDAITFDGDIHLLNLSEQTLFERLQGNDITKLRLIYVANTDETFNAPWEDLGDDIFTNQLQHTAIDSNGHMYVQIKTTIK